MDIERKAFEDAYLEIEQVAIFDRDQNGEYESEEERKAWSLWQAARQAPASGEVEPVTEADAPAYLWDKNGRYGWAVGMNTHPPAKVPEGLIEAVMALDPDDDMFGIDFQDEMSTYACRYCDFDMEFFGTTKEAVERINHDKNCPVQSLRNLLTTPTTATTAGAEFPDGDRDKVVWGVYNHLSTKFDFNKDPALDIVGYLVDAGFIATKGPVFACPECENEPEDKDHPEGLCDDCKADRLNRPTPPQEQ